ncbi:MAG: hypothetical protein F4Y03_18125, partial [Alphaproteobacteria bacterium]|nr:hypothetical protein [Alphaproteobacteria bacterium]
MTTRPSRSTTWCPANTTTPAPTRITSHATADMPASLRLELIGLDAAGRRLGKLADAGRDLTPVFADIGEYLVRTTKDRFRSQTDPSGRPWKPLSESYRKRKKRNK